MSTDLVGVVFGTYDLDFIVPIAHALKAKARRDILSILYLRGEMSPIELARGLGASATSLVTHIKTLRDLGLIEETSAARAHYRKVLRLNVPIVRLELVERLKKELGGSVSSFVQSLYNELRSNLYLSGLTDVELKALCLALLCSIAGETLGVEVTLIHL